MGNNIKYCVSVCISVHNTEHLLRRCLNSVMSQTLSGIEVVLVNNGSTDSSLSIMREYKEKYPKNIKIYSQEDMGLAQGRQTGINNANGEYITFLDADDYVTNDAYEKMYSTAINKNVDIVECCTLREGNIIESKYCGKYKTSQVLKDYFVYNNIPPMMWLRLYHSRLFDTDVLPKMYVNNEDIFAFPCLLYRAENIFFIKDQLHYYTTDNENSVMNIVKRKANNEDRIINNRVKTLKVIQHIEKTIGKDVIDNEMSNEFSKYKAKVILDFCLNSFITLKPSDSLEIALTNTGANFLEMEKCFRYIHYSNKFIKFCVNTLGFKKTVMLYRMSMKVLSITKK